MTKEMKLRMRMQDKVMRKFGFENEFTLWFCDLCGKVAETQSNNEKIVEAYNFLMKNRG